MVLLTLTVSIDLKWTNIFVGAQYDKNNKTLNVCPLPFCCIEMDFRRP